MHVEQIEEDVACVYGWWEKKVTDLERAYIVLPLPKVPLLLTVLCEDQEKVAKSILNREGWRKVGWYPSCHNELEDGERVSLFCKERDCKPRSLPRVKYDRLSFNQGVPSLGCSCNAHKARRKLTQVVDVHCTLGIHRHAGPAPLRKTVGNWHRFAVTPLASYWFWGLKPEETNRRKYE